MIMKPDKAHVKVAMMSYIVVGGLINVRPPICYPQVPFQVAFRFLLRVPRYQWYKQLVSATKGTILLQIGLVRQVISHHRLPPLGKEGILVNCWPQIVIRYF